jgi:hypothetical protein
MWKIIDQDWFLAGVVGRQNPIFRFGFALVIFDRRSV